ncbi:hypothetical protein DO97_13485 [Neosynechococcus sphagnicola sy1]|uniref:Uncharacterized protein n=1 Tax=Neosynechococcus sphagnicola sy1 TaxID=1497020 RepID=A0A098TJ51_9CYAN|nr:hypothetical protein DO97_13485 [Neosynechococcus sphagnicola sy1]
MVQTESSQTKKPRWITEVLKALQQTLLRSHRKSVGKLSVNLGRKLSAGRLLSLALQLQLRS